MNEGNFFFIFYLSNKLFFLFKLRCREQKTNFNIFFFPSHFLLFISLSNYFVVQKFICKTYYIGSVEECKLKSHLFKIWNKGHKFKLPFLIWIWHCWIFFLKGWRLKLHHFLVHMCKYLASLIVCTVNKFVYSVIFEKIPTAHIILTLQ
jgi:hypothetical protein